MDGFVTSAATSTGTDGHFVMGHYEQGDLPFYYWLASTFALNDRHFASVRSGTFPNRDFLLLGTSDGVQATRRAATRSVDADDLRRARHGGRHLGRLQRRLAPQRHARLGPLARRDGAPSQTFLQTLDDGTLPQVTFVDGLENVEDEHPTADLQRGEAGRAPSTTHAVASRSGRGSRIVWTYDEAGGFADHVPPPNQACVARPVARTSRSPSSACACRSSSSRRGRAPVRVARRAGAHVDHALRRGGLRPARADGARREQRRAARHVRLRLRARLRDRAHAARDGRRRLRRRRHPHRRQAVVQAGRPDRRVLQGRPGERPEGLDRRLHVPLDRAHAARRRGRSSTSTSAGPTRRRRRPRAAA